MLNFCEILSTIVQSCSPDLKSKFALNTSLNGTYRLLSILNKYRSHEITSEDHHEALVNLLDTL